ncbi:protein of unknown function [Clostridium beijerinckii]|nr:protein of unknown function [Clostridium beijerinckii]
MKVILLNVGARGILSHQNVYHVVSVQDLAKQSVFLIGNNILNLKINDIMR